MGMPQGIGVIDTLIDLPAGDLGEMPHRYLYKQRPEVAGSAGSDPVGALLSEMDRFGIDRGMIPVREPGDLRAEAIRRHPDRLFGSGEADPTAGAAGVEQLRRLHGEVGLKAATSFPAGYHVAIDDPRYFPLYEACIDLDIAICVCAGVPGPRLPLSPQKVERIDEVCWRYPELRFVTRHGCEPWTALAVKLLLKWPGLYYSTSAFAPKHYPADIVEFANTRGADKVLYAGYFPMGLSLERIFAELPAVPFRDHVWAKFLRDNAVKVFKL
jgi:predicted TIM-barrel fold metal-dependent hydrolase